MRTFLTSVAAAILAVLLSAAAAAQEPGVTLDPGSPSGKEYEIPLDTARSQAAPPAADEKPAPEKEAEPQPEASTRAPAPQSQPAPQQERSSPLFGAGVEEPESAEPAPPQEGTSPSAADSEKRRKDEKARRQRQRDAAAAGERAGSEEVGSATGDKLQDGAAERVDAQVATASGGVGGTAIVVGVGVLLLLVAAGAGILFRRSARRAA